MRLALLPALAFVWALTWSTTAHAIPPYPGDLQAALGLSYTPQCSLCHQGGVTGLGTVTTPFGVSMRKYGLTDDPTTFMGALDQMESNNVDSVGRGFSDIEALKMDVDPDVIPPNAIPTSPLPPSYGCSVSTVVQASEGGEWAWMAGMLAILCATVARNREVRKG
jgi:hypothetical protein